MPDAVVGIAASGNMSGAPNPRNERVPTHRYRILADGEWLKYRHADGPDLDTVERVAHWLTCFTMILSAVMTTDDWREDTNRVAGIGRASGTMYE